MYAANPEGSQSIIEYRAYDGDPKTAAWQASLEDGEKAIVVAGGGSRIDPDDLDGNGMGCVAIATSKGYIRFFTGTGLQRYIWRLGEEVVAMVASREMLFIVHREGGTSVDGRHKSRGGGHTLSDCFFARLPKSQIYLDKFRELRYNSGRSDSASETSHIDLDRLHDLRCK